MRHHKATRKFGRVRKVRIGLMKSLTRALVLESKIVTTDAKARELRPVVEKMITLGKKKSTATHKILSSRAGKQVANKIISEISPKYNTRSGGYTRITKLPRRNSDGGLMAVIEFV